ncbi:MAG: hypothetical protein DA407_01150 [Bacteroidetes bacterium]|nr:MAG: hypothetical protein DA407_01150 [Bacteroidota bacterium]
MIKFFRKIRYDLMNQNKTTKYFKYAIGEIVLVMFGILLALQVSEWNSERNRKKAETIVLEQLKADLKKSIVELEEVKTRMEASARASAIVCQAFWKKETPHDSIYRYMRIPQSTTMVSPILGTARSLVNSGNITLLKSNALKNDITSYIEKVDYILKDISRYEETYYRRGQMLLSEVAGTVNMLSKEGIKKRLESEDFANSETTRSDEYSYIPNKIEKIPFETDLKQLFQNQKVYSAYNSLLTAHRNSAFRYNHILEITHELLVKPEEASN